MNEQRLSKRLGKVAEYVRLNDRLADIGSDHAYLPAWLILNQRIDYAVAGEVVDGPYQAAKRLVAQLSLNEQLTVRLADGLAAIHEDDRISTISIAGMGGRLISEILERGYHAGHLTGQERLILQPNVGERILREWLVRHRYEIIAEAILSEDDKIYEVIVAEKVAVASALNEQELYFGPFLLKEKSSIFKVKWQQELRAKKRIMTKMLASKSSPSKRLTEVAQQIKWMEAISK